LREQSGELAARKNSVVCGKHISKNCLHALRMVSVHGEAAVGEVNSGRQVFRDIEYKKGIRWMPWHQEAMKDVARCEKPRGAASRR
jgi:hypothetical protein